MTAPDEQTEALIVELRQFERAERIQGGWLTADRYKRAADALAEVAVLRVGWERTAAERAWDAAVWYEKLWRYYREH